MSFGLSNFVELSKFWQVQDERYFKDHPDRKSHIRKAHDNECLTEFESLGDHEKYRRKIVLIRVDFYGRFLPDRQVLKIPVIAYADETIEDRDDILIPMVEEIMRAEAIRQGIAQ